MGRVQLRKPPLFEHRSKKITGAVIGVLGIMSGLLLALAWGCMFPSRIEKWMWRFSSVGCLVLAMVYLFLMWKKVERIGDRLVTYVIPGLFLFLRICLLVGAFAGLRLQSLEVYRVPSWAGYFPSFGS